MRATFIETQCRRSSCTGLVNKETVIVRFKLSQPVFLTHHGSMLSRQEHSGHYIMGRVGHGPSKILVGCATMHFAPPTITGLYVC